MVLFITLLLMGIGLAMDAFAVSICKGLAMRKVNKKQCFVIALFFGGFQALMPAIGWLLGSRFEQYIVNVDHWIAFILLGWIGGKMIWDAVREKEGPDIVEQMDAPLDIRELLVMAVATSIDALAVGITFAFLGTPILEASLIIGVTTFVICVIGVYVGNFFGSKYKRKASIAGGIILVLLGIKILLEHLEVFTF